MKVKLIKTLIVLGVTIGCLVAIYGLAWTKLSPPSPSNLPNKDNLTSYISMADQALEDLVTVAPQQKVIAIASFRQGIAPEAAIEKASAAGLKVKGFFHFITVPDGTLVGGYKIRLSWTIDQSLLDYKEKIYYFLQDAENQTLKLLEQKRGTEEEKALIDLLNRIRQYRRYYILNGLKVFGLELEGKAEDLLKFRKQESIVVSVEVNDGKRRAMPILPQD